MKLGTGGGRTQEAFGSSWCTLQLSSPAGISWWLVVTGESLRMHTYIGPHQSWRFPGPGTTYDWWWKLCMMSHTERTLSSAHTHTCTVQLPSFFALGGPLLTLPLPRASAVAVLHHQTLYKSPRAPPPSSNQLTSLASIHSPSRASDRASSASIQQLRASASSIHHRLLPAGPIGS